MRREGLFKKYLQREGGVMVEIITFLLKDFLTASHCERCTFLPSQQTIKRQLFPSVYKTWPLGSIMSNACFISLLSAKLLWVQDIGPWEKYVPELGMKMDQSCIHHEPTKSYLVTENIRASVISFQPFGQLSQDQGLWYWKPRGPYRIAFLYGSPFLYLEGVSFEVGLWAG